MIIEFSPKDISTLFHSEKFFFEIVGGALWAEFKFVSPFFYAFERRSKFLFYWLYILKIMAEKFI